MPPVADLGARMMARVVVAVAALRTGSLEGKYVRASQVELGREVFCQDQCRSWSRLAQGELQVRCAWLASIMGGSTAHGDGSVNAEGGVYRKTTNDGGIRFLRAEHVALPDKGGQPVAFLPDFVEDELIQHLGPPQELFGARTRSGPRPVKAVFKVREPDYASLLVLLRERNMVEFRSEAAYCVNGLFGVPKGEVGDPLTRMITDSRPTNCMTKQLTGVELPNPGKLLELPAWIRRAAALDIHSFYNCLRLPEEWKRFSGCQRSRAISWGAKKTGSIRLTQHCLWGGQ